MKYKIIIIIKRNLLCRLMSLSIVAVDVLMGSMTVHDIPLPSQPPSQPLDLADVPLPPDEQPPLPPCPPEPDTEQVRQYGQQPA